MRELCWSFDMPPTCGVVELISVRYTVVGWRAASRRPALATSRPALETEKFVLKFVIDGAGAPAPPRVWMNQGGFAILSQQGERRNTSIPTREARTPIYFSRDDTETKKYACAKNNSVTARNVFVCDGSLGRVASAVRNSNIL